MTTPAAFSPQVSVPTKTVAAARDAGERGRGDKPDDGDNGFGKVLTKLQRDDAPKAAESDKRADTQTDATGATADEASIDALLDSLTAAGDQQPVAGAAQDAAPPSAPPATQLSDMIAAATLASAQMAPANAATDAMAGAKAEKTGDRAILPDPKSSVLPPSDIDAAPPTPPDDVPVQPAFATPPEPAVASSVARAAAPQVKDAQEARDRDTTVTVAADAVATPATPHDRPAPPKTAATVTRQEVHFAPVPPSADPHPASEESADAGGETSDSAGPVASSTDGVLPLFDDPSSSVSRPAQQIADRIIAEAGAVADPPVQTASVPGQTGAKSALKVLHIQLQPLDLGTVTIRMELKDTELSLHVEAERADTADLIRNDQDTLSNLLRSAGYSVDPSSVRVAETDRTAASQQIGQGGTQSGFQSSQQSQSGASQRNDQQQRGNGGNTNDGGSGSPAGRNDGNGTNTERAGSGLYL
jgi:chemotaxis protein MotD